MRMCHWIAAFASFHPPGPPSPTSSSDSRLPLSPEKKKELISARAGGERGKTTKPPRYSPRVWGARGLERKEWLHTDQIT